MQRFSALASLGVGTALSLMMVEMALAQTQPPDGNVAPGAADLIRLNPNPDPLSLPTRPEQVEIDLNQPITLQQAIELARRNNRELQTIESQLRQSRAALRQAQAALFPTLSLQTSIIRTESATTKLINRQTEQQFAESSEITQSLLGSPQTSNPVSNLTSTTIQVAYNAFTFGQRDASIKAAREQVRFSELDLSRQFEQLRFTVTDDYYNIQQADAIVRIAKAAVDNSQISLRDTVARERAGLGTRFDVLQAQVQLANNQQQLTQAISDQQTARRQLAQTLSVANTVNLSAADPIQVAGKWTLSLADSIVLGLKSRVELEQQIAQRNIALQQRRVALANLGPQIAVGSTLNTTDSITDKNAPNWGYSVTGQLSLNIFEGGASRASAAQQSASAAIAETQFASFKNLIRFQIEQSYNTLQASASNIETNRTAVEQATEGLRLARLRFQAGVGTQLEVSNAESSLTRAQSNLLSATVTYNRALASLQRFVSNLPLNFPNATATAPATPTAP
jgi:outer membrane factor, OMF family